VPFSMSSLIVALLYLYSTLSGGFADAQCGQRNPSNGQCVRTSVQNFQSLIDGRPQATDEPATLVQSRLLLRDAYPQHASQSGNQTSDKLLTTIAPYKGSTLISATPVSQVQVEVVKDLVMGQLGIDAWTERIGLHLPATLLIPKGGLATVASAMRDAGMEPEVLIEDIAKKLQYDHEVNQMQVKKGIIGSYPRLDEIYRWCDSLANQYSFVSVFSIGTTHESREIKVVKIARRSGLPIVLIECGTHAREWISVASCLWHINELLTSSEPSVQELSEKVEFQIIPCHNPDGYEWTHLGDRLWRKNRNPNAGHDCKGVDLNRNWDSRWGTTKAVSFHKCNEMYCGTEPFSEPETKALSEHMLWEKERIKAFIEFHSFGQHWLVPPGSGPKPADFNRLQEVGEEAAWKMEQVAGSVYDAGPPKDIMYAFSGGSLDWSHDSLKGPGIKYTYTVELRPMSHSTSGFQLPQREIPEASKEAFAGLKHVAQVVMKENAGASPSLLPAGQPTAVPAFSARTPEPSLAATAAPTPWPTPAPWPTSAPWPTPALD